MPALKNWVMKTMARTGYPIIPVWRLRRLEQTRHLQELFDRLGIDCVLDVGANIGQFHEFLRVFLDYRGRVVSFEPVAELYEQIVRSASADPQWSVRKVALGEADGSATVNVFTERTLSSILQRDETALKAMGYAKYLRETELARTEEVPLRRLDTVFGDTVGSPDAKVFLKIDTQGYDMQVIRGAAGCLDRIAALQIELSIRPVYKGAPSYLDALRELADLGLEITGLFPVQRDPALRVVNFDCVMINSRVATLV